ALPYKKGPSSKGKCVAPGSEPPLSLLYGLAPFFKAPPPSPVPTNNAMINLSLSKIGSSDETPASPTTPSFSTTILFGEKPLPTSGRICLKSPPALKLFHSL